MSDQPDNLVLNLLRAARGDLAGLKADMVEVKERLGLLMDRVVGDVGRIMRRLDTADASAT